ncbi:hypothetical protein [Adhaeretor mobilis]|uniref:Uncharacterized protein n=1 Tax=Adhaeretor mobilis TaxID=1930276 RepID=A0A517MXZ9_9BACT|nr:hypothetical protein [Adhaeretor mobilis]QDS99736.1 hypothetical protein HG15A2_30660 [Adhaeretor mobilis]
MFKQILSTLTSIQSKQGQQRQVELLSRQVAEQSLSGVTQLIAGSTSGMTLCETRGYIRARSGKEIRRQTRLLLASGTTGSGDITSAIIRKATERLVPRVLRQLVAGQIGHAPQAVKPQAALRLAA